MDDLMRAKDVLDAIKRNREHLAPDGEDGAVVTGYRMAHDHIAEIIMRTISTVQDVRPVRWIPAEERLPKLFQPVIVCRKGKDGKPMVEAGSMDHNGWWKVYGTRTKTVTHWMPLPELPSVNGKETEHDTERKG